MRDILIRRLCASITCVRRVSTWRLRKGPRKVFRLAAHVFARPCPIDTWVTARRHVDFVTFVHRTTWFNHLCSSLTHLLTLCFPTPLLFSSFLFLFFMKINTLRMEDVNRHLLFLKRR